MHTIRDRLLTAEDDFHAALIEGGDAISAFNIRWETLLDDIDLADQTTGLDLDMATLAHATASRVAVLAEISAEIYSNCDALTSQLMDDIEVLMGDLAITDREFDKPTPLTLPSDGIVRIATSLPFCAPTGKRRRDSCDTLPQQNLSKKRRLHSMQANTSDSQVSSRKSSSTSPPFLPAPVNNQPSSPRLDVPQRVSRKRRLSDADVCAPPPKTRRMYIGPRLHAVSDSYALSPPSSLETVDICKPLDWAHLDPTAGANNGVDLQRLDSVPSLLGLPLSPLPTIATVAPHTSSESVDSRRSQWEDLDDFLQSLIHADVSGIPPVHLAGLDTCASVSSPSPVSPPSLSSDSCGSSPESSVRLPSTPVSPLSLSSSADIYFNLSPYQHEPAELPSTSFVLCNPMHDASKETTKLMPADTTSSCLFDEAPLDAPAVDWSLLLRSLDTYGELSPSPLFSPSYPSITGCADASAFNFLEAVVGIN